MCICINNELSTQCSIWAWLLAFSEWQEPLKKLPGFQRFRDDLANMSFVTDLSRIASKVPGNILWNHRPQLLHCQNSTAALTYRETVRNKKLEAFHGAPKAFFLMLYLDIGLPLQMLLIFQTHYFNSVYTESATNTNANKLRSINQDTYLQF